MSQGQTQIAEQKAVSAPPKPSLGRVVIYSDPYSEMDVAALVTKVYAPVTGEAQAGAGGMVVDICSFAPAQMPFPVARVRYSAVQEKGCWRWPERV